MISARIFALCTTARPILPLRRAVLACSSRRIPGDSPRSEGTILQGGTIIRLLKVRMRILCQGGPTFSLCEPGRQTRGGATFPCDPRCPALRLQACVLCFAVPSRSLPVENKGTWGASSEISTSHLIAPVRSDEGGRKFEISTSHLIAPGKEWRGCAPVCPRLAPRDGQTLCTREGRSHRRRATRSWRPGNVGFAPETQV